MNYPGTATVQTHEIEFIKQIKKKERERLSIATVTTHITTLELEKKINKNTIMLTNMQQVLTMFTPELQE